MTRARSNRRSECSRAFDDWACAVIGPIIARETARAKIEIWRISTSFAIFQAPLKLKNIIKDKRQSIVINFL
jgi:hypothetical protein